MLDHEKLDVYRCSLDFLSRSIRIGERLPPGNAQLLDQLRRAATSIPLNIAEGVGKTSPADKRRFFSIARGSTMECAAILDIFAALKCASGEEMAQAKSLLERCAAMLSKLARR